MPHALARTIVVAAALAASLTACTPGGSPTPSSPATASAGPVDEARYDAFLADATKTLTAELKVSPWTKTVRGPEMDGTQHRWASPLHTVAVPVDVEFSKRVKPALDPVLAGHGFQPLSELTAKKGTGFLEGKAADGRGGTLEVSMRETLMLAVVVD